MFNEEDIEIFIRKNKNDFEVYVPPENHMDKFLLKLNLRIKHIVSIVPYLIKASIVTIIIFIASILIWNNYIRKDRDEISLKNKITSVTTKAKDLKSRDK